MPASHHHDHRQPGPVARHRCRGLRVLRQLSLHAVQLRRGLPLADGRLDDAHRPRPDHLRRPTVRPSPLGRARRAGRFGAGCRPHAPRRPRSRVAHRPAGSPRYVAADRRGPCRSWLWAPRPQDGRHRLRHNAASCVGLRAAGTRIQLGGRGATGLRPRPGCPPHPDGRQRRLGPRRCASHRHQIDPARTTGALGPVDVRYRGLPPHRDAVEGVPGAALVAHRCLVQRSVPTRVPPAADGHSDRGHRRRQSC